MQKAEKGENIQHFEFGNRLQLGREYSKSEQLTEQYIPELVADHHGDKIDPKDGALVGAMGTP